MSQQDGYHYDIAIDVTWSGSGMAINYPVDISADYVSPGRIQGSFAEEFMGEFYNVEFIAIGSEKYQRVLGVNQWHSPSYFEDLIILPYPGSSWADEIPFREGPDRISQGFKDGVSFYHISAVMPPDTFADSLGTTLGGVTVEFWIDLQQQLITEMLVEGEFISTKLLPDIPGYETSLTAHFQFSDFGKHVVIMTPKLAPQPDQVSGSYELPYQFTSEVPDAWYVQRNYFEGVTFVGNYDPNDLNTIPEDGMAQILVEELDYLPDSPLELIEDHAKRLGSQYTIVQEPVAIQINGQRAATWTIREVEESSALTLHITAIFDHGRGFSLTSYTYEWSVNLHASEFALFVDNFNILALPPGPAITPNVGAPPGFQTKEFESAGISLSLPEGWHVIEADGIYEIKGRTPEIQPLAIPGLDSIFIYPPDKLLNTLSFLGNDAYLDNLLLQQQLVIDQVQVNSETSVNLNGDHESTAIFISGKHEEESIEGILAVINRGDRFVGVFAWTDDLETQLEKWQQIVGSIEVWDQATVTLRMRELKPSIIFDNTTAEHRAADIWFGASTAKRYLLLIHSEEPGNYTLFDPAGEAVLQQGGLAGVVTPARLLPPLVDGPYSIQLDNPTTADYIVDRLPYQALLLELDLGSLPNGSYLLGDLQVEEPAEFNFDNQDGGGVIIYAAPTGIDAAAHTLALALFDGAGDFLYTTSTPDVAGEPVSIIWNLPPGGDIIVSLAEADDQPASYELLILPLESEYLELFAPRSLEPLSDGDAHTGELLYTNYKCHRCHGFLTMPGSHSSGPWLGNIGNDAAQRVEGMGAVEYLTYALTAPDIHLGHECLEQPCEQVIMEVDFGDGINRQELADLVAYLQSLKED